MLPRKIATECNHGAALTADLETAEETALGRTALQDGR